MKIKLNTTNNVLLYRHSCWHSFYFSFLDNGLEFALVSVQVLSDRHTRLTEMATISIFPPILFVCSVRGLFNPKWYLEPHI